MKKVLNNFCNIIIFLILIMISLAGCQKSENPEHESIAPPTVETPHYTLEAIDGKAYLTMKDIDTWEDSDFGGIIDYHLYFSSVSEMREKLIKGDLSDEQLLTIQQFIQIPGNLDETGKMKIVNLNQLSDLDLKDGTITRVGVLGEKYYFDIQTNDAVGVIMIRSKDDFDNKLQGEYSALVDRTDVKVERQTTGNHDVDEYIITAPLAKTRVLVYTHINSFGTYTVFESYVLESKLNAYRCSEMIPAYCHVYFEASSGYYLELYLYHFEKPLSVEELTSFRLKPFVNKSSDSIFSD